MTIVRERRPAGFLDMNVRLVFFWGGGGGVGKCDFGAMPPGGGGGGQESLAYETHMATNSCYSKHN